MEVLPIEVLANQIFKYFSFDDWIATLVRVCKHWQQAAISSNASKQLIVDLDRSQRYACVSILSKYRVDTLLLIDGVGQSIRELVLVLNASPKLNTLVFIGHDYDFQVLMTATSMQEMNEIEPKGTFPHITTLALSDLRFPMLQLFPNVTKLRLEDWDCDEWEDLEESEVPIFPKVRELEVACDSLGNLNRIEFQFPFVETLHVTSLDYAKNDEIKEQGKKMGITVYIDNPHLVKTSWNSPNISYHLFSMQHRKSPLVYPLLSNNTECSVEQFQEILARTSPMYEEELASKRKAEFSFPARITRLSVDDLAVISEASNTRNPALIKPYYTNKYINYPTAFRLALRCTEMAYPALELAVELSEHLDEFHSFKDIVKLFERISILLQFMDEVGSETTKKIMAATAHSGLNVIGEWAMHKTQPIEWMPFDEYIDWNTKVKMQTGTDQYIQVNLATAAFRNQQFDKWKMLVREKKLPAEIELYPEALVGSYIKRFGLAHLDLLAPTLEATQTMLFCAASALDQESDLSLLSNIIAKFGREGLQECRNGEYSIQYLIRTSSARSDLQHNLPYLVHNLELDINYIDKSGKTPLALFLADKLSHHESTIETLELLLSEDADPNLAGDTMLPLFLAMNIDSDSLEHEQIARVIELLLDYGADINVVDFDINGRRATPLSMAVSRGLNSKIIKLLISRGADTKFVDDAGNTLLHTLLLADELDAIIALIPLLTPTVDINQANLLDETPLHRALLSGYDTSLIAALVQNGADVNLPGGPTLQTPLIMALNYLPALKVLLLTEKIDIKAKNRYGESVFYALCRIKISSGDYEDFDALLEGKESIQTSKSTLTQIPIYRQRVPGRCRKACHARIRRRRNQKIYERFSAGLQNNLFTLHARPETDEIFDRNSWI
jgi:ankyrin repeat protein